MRSASSASLPSAPAPLPNTANTSNAANAASAASAADTAATTASAAAAASAASACSTIVESGPAALTDAPRPPTTRERPPDGEEDRADSMADSTRLQEDGDESASAWDASLAPLALSDRFDDGMLTADGLNNVLRRKMLSTLDSMLLEQDQPGGAATLKLTRFDHGAIET